MLAKLMLVLAMAAVLASSLYLADGVERTDANLDWVAIGSALSSD